MTHKSRFMFVKLCKPTEKYNITILHGEEEQNIADRSYKKQRIFVGTVHIYRFIPSIPIPFD